jgi:hypothetical protein
LFFIFRTKFKILKAIPSLWLYQSYAPQLQAFAHAIPSAWAIVPILQVSTECLYPFLSSHSPTI